MQINVSEFRSEMLYYMLYHSQSKEGVTSWFGGVQATQLNKLLAVNKLVAVNKSFHVYTLFSLYFCRM
jgi:hypothetical protein